MKIIDEIKEFKLYEQAVLLLSRTSIDDGIIAYLNGIMNSHDFDWDRFMGTIINHRVNGVVYRNMLNLDHTPLQVERTLQYIYMAQGKRNMLHRAEIKKIFEELEKANVKYAFLKGSVLNSVFYKYGERISNDTDIMVSPSDLTKVSKICSELGYFQGFIKKGVEVPATKKEILFAKMNTYEIVPFVKKIDSEFFPFHSIDINYKLSNDEDGKLSEVLIENTEIIEYSNHKIRSMSIENFLIYLCVHLYREATMLFKIRSGDDLALYKFMDIHFYISKMNDKINWIKLKETAVYINRFNDVYYTLYYTEKLYPGTINLSILELFKPKNVEYLNQYFGKDNSNEVYNWDMTFEQRMFNCERCNEAMRNLSEESQRFDKIMGELKSDN